MRKQFVECPTRYEAQEICPWACRVLIVDGGFMCFESADDCETFLAQA